MSKIEQNKTFYQLISEPLIIPDYQRVCTGKSQ